MPRHSSAPSLLEVCLSSVLRHMEDLWCADFCRQQRNNSSSFLYVVGPFDDLPDKLSRRILAELKARRQLRRHHVQLLVNAFTT